ncbi:MAG: hypothetical protein GF365_00660 [Candidatus Buchananbacteria bacterium]|nr:hypothetical protein [Candidatus Buchananbacteria bacterium]
MNKFFKIALALSFLILCLILGDFVLAQGDGYFLEKGNEFFIFDNLYVNGYLTVGNDMLGETANLGDVLVGDRLILDADSSFTFCKKELQSGTNAILNRDCEDKIMVWHSVADKGLEVLDTNFYELNTNNIETWPHSIIMQPNNRIYTEVPVKLIGMQGCFSNRDSDCNDDELETTTVKLNSIALFGDNTNIKINSANINLGNIDLGSFDDFKRHDLCWLASSINSCPKGFTHPAFKETPEEGSVTVTRSLDRVEGNVLCCYLNIAF